MNDSYEAQFDKLLDQAVAHKPSYQELIRKAAEYAADRNRGAVQTQNPYSHPLLDSGLGNRRMDSVTMREILNQQGQIQARVYIDGAMNALQGMQGVPEYIIGGKKAKSGRLSAAQLDNFRRRFQECAGASDEAVEAFAASRFGEQVRKLNISDTPKFSLGGGISPINGIPAPLDTKITVPAAMPLDKDGVARHALDITTTAQNGIGPMVMTDITPKMDEPEGPAIERMTGPAKKTFWQHVKGLLCVMFTVEPGSKDSMRPMQPYPRKE